MGPSVGLFLPTFYGLYFSQHFTKVIIFTWKISAKNILNYRCRQYKPLCRTTIGGDLGCSVKILNQKRWVVCVCFFSLSLPTKLHCYDVTMCAVEIWGQERGRERVSGCPTCEQKKGKWKGKIQRVHTNKLTIYPNRIFCVWSLKLSCF